MLYAVSLISTLSLAQSHLIPGQTLIRLIFAHIQAYAVTHLPLDLRGSLFEEGRM